MSDIVIGLAQLSLIVSGLLIFYFVARVIGFIYEEARLRTIDAMAETLRRENEHLLRQVEARRMSQPVDYPVCGGPDGI